jgi:hypothetical protein
VVRFGLEGSGNYGQSTALWLLEHRVAVVEVPPLLTAWNARGSPSPRAALQGASQAGVQEVCQLLVQVSSARDELALAQNGLGALDRSDG